MTRDKIMATISALLRQQPRNVLVIRVCEELVRLLSEKDHGAPQTRVSQPAKPKAEAGLRSLRHG